MTINMMVEAAHEMAKEKGWWNPDRNIAECLALIHSEVSEALEELRSGKPVIGVQISESGKPEGFGVELADIVIRVADLCGRYQIDLEKLIQQKMAYNSTRPVRHGKMF